MKHILCFILIFVSGCFSVNYQKEIAKVLNDAGKTVVLIDSAEKEKVIYVYRVGGEAYGPEGKQYNIKQQGEEYYLVDGNKPLKEITGRYVWEQVFQGLKNLVDIEIESKLADNVDDLKLYTILPCKEYASDKDTKDFADKLGAEIEQYQREIIRQIRERRDMPSESAKQKMTVFIYRYLGKVEEAIINACLDSRGVMRIPVLLNLYRKIREQVYSRGGLIAT